MTGAFTRLAAAEMAMGLALDSLSRMPTNEELAAMVPKRNVKTDVKPSAEYYASAIARREAKLARRAERAKKGERRE